MTSKRNLVRPISVLRSFIQNILLRILGFSWSFRSIEWQTYRRSASSYRCMILYNEVYYYMIKKLIYISFLEKYLFFIFNALQGMNHIQIKFLTGTKLIHPYVQIKKCVVPIRNKWVYHYLASCFCYILH